MSLHKSFMRKQILIIIAVALLVIVLGVILAFKKSGIVASDGQQNSAANNSILSADQTFYDFGTISMKNGKVGKVFKVTNSTAGAININKLYTSCMCTDSAIQINGQHFGPFSMPGMGFVPELNQVLSVNDTAEVTVTFDPNTHGPSGVGTIERAVTLEDDSGQKLVILNFKANVTP